MRIYTATVIPGVSEKDAIRIPEPAGILEPGRAAELHQASETGLPEEITHEPLIDFPTHGEAEATGKPVTVEMAAHGQDFTDVASRYDVGTMTGTDVIHFANDLIAAGVDQTDALAVTWPINCRNLLRKIGKEAAAPKLDSWDDVVRLHRARRDLADRRFLHCHSEQLERLISLVESLHLAASDFDWSGPGH